MKTDERVVSPYIAKLIGIISVFLFAVFLTSFPAMAQSSGEVSGTVTDPSGAIVSGATVTLKNVDTNAERTTTTSSAGLFSFPNVQPAQHTVTITSTGFSNYKASVEVTVGARLTLEVKLTVSNSAVTVDVSSNQTALVNTSTPEVSQVISQEQISQLPSLTRNPYDFVALSGNVSAGDNTAAGNVQNGANRGVNFSLNGQRNSGTEILLDGVENITVFTDAVGIKVPLDDVQEYRIITNNFSPEYGRASGGVVAVATRSGTNAFHGSGWEFNRIAATTANTVTNAQEGIAKGQYTRNQFGGAVGGPILKDKLFFFASTEFIRVRSASPQIAAVPTSQLLAAAPANVQSYFSTFGGNTNFNVLSTTSNLQAGGGAAPLYSQLDPSTPVFNVVQFLAPGDAGGGVPQNTYNITGRVDYNLGEKTQAFFRYVDYHELDQSGSSFSSPYPQYNVGELITNQAYLLSLAHEFNPALSTITKASFSRFDTSNSYNTALQNVPTLFVSPNAQDPFSGKAFQFPGFYDTNPANGGLPFGGPQNTVQVNQDVNLTKGRHQIQSGAQILYIQDNNAYGAYAQASEQLGFKQPQGLQALLTGNLYQFSAAVNPQGALPCVKNQYTGAYTQTPACTITLPASQPSFARSDRFHDWAVYAQDQWKATPRVTLSYGLRYEYFGVQHNNNANLDSNFVYGPGTSLPEQIRTGNIQVATTSPVGGLWKPQYGTASPRLGFAYDVFGNGKTSVRGGYGISYERNFGNVTFNIIQNPPGYAVVVSTGTDAIPVPVTNSNSGPLNGTGSVPLPNTSARAVDQNIRTAQTQFQSLSIDQELAPGTVLEVTYNGARGIHLYDIKNYNGLGGGNFLLGDPVVDPVSGDAAATRLNSQYSNINNRGSNGDSYYSALNFQLTAHNIHQTGLSLVANYTFAHATDDLSTTFSETSAGNFALGYTDPFNPSLDHGNSDFDIRNRFVFAPIYQTPSFANKGRLFSEILGGYNLNGIYSVRTGTPFTYYDTTTDYSGYNVPRYNPITPVKTHTFKSIPKGATNTGNNYTLTSDPIGGTSATGAALPEDQPFGNPLFEPLTGPATPATPTTPLIPAGISDWGPYPSTMTARNSFRGPGAYNLDVSIAKQFPIHEKVNLELRAEGFDVTNHHNLYIQQSQNDAFNSISNGTTPQITASKGGVTGGVNDERRFLQFAGKINF
jgi:Carboxypeptidase regulatory-like domain